MYALSYFLLVIKNPTVAMINPANGQITPKVLNMLWPPPTNNSSMAIATAPNKIKVSPYKIHLSDLINISSFFIMITYEQKKVKLKKKKSP